MSIYEYDKEFEEKKLRKAEFEYGQHELLKTQIQKKLAKGKSINKFADALEGSPLVIRKFIDELFSLLPAGCPSAPCILRSFF